MTTKFQTISSNSKNIHDLVQQALTNLNWNYKEVDDFYIVKFGVNVYSWGSTLKITFVNDHQCNLEIKPLLFTQVIDWGDSTRKMKKLIMEIQSLDQK